MYKAAIGRLGISRTDFWQMHPREFWWTAEAMRPPRYLSGLTEAEYRECQREVEEWRRSNARRSPV